MTDRPALQHALRQFARAITRSAVADLQGTPDPLASAQQQIDEAIDDVMDEMEPSPAQRSITELVADVKALKKETRYVN